MKIRHKILTYISTTVIPIVAIPRQNKMVWAGEFESKERATKQLAVIVPAVLVLILFLLYFNFGSTKDTLIAASTIPFAFIGGFISLWVTGTTLEFQQELDSSFFLE